MYGNAIVFKLFKVYPHTAVPEHVKVVLVKSSTSHSKPTADRQDLRIYDRQSQEAASESPVTACDVQVADRSISK